MRFLQWQADLIGRVFTPERMMTTGVVMLDLSFLYVPYYFFSGEKFGVYSMSALALFFGGIVMVAEAQRALKEDSNE